MMEVERLDGDPGTGFNRLVPFHSTSRWYIADFKATHPGFVELDRVQIFLSDVPSHVTNYVSNNTVIYVHVQSKLCELASSTASIVCYLVALSSTDADLH